MKLTGLSDILEAYSIKSSKREVDRIGGYGTTTVVDFIIVNDDNGAGVLSGSLDTDYIIKSVSANATEQDMIGGIEAIISNDHRRGISIGASAPAIQPLLQKMQKDGKLTSGGRPTKKFFQEFGVEKYKKDQLGMDYLPTSSQTKKTKPLPAHATNSIQAALAYHKKMFGGKRWPALEQAFLKRAHLITNPKGGDFVRPRISVFAYMNQIIDRWPEGEELMKAFLTGSKSRGRDISPTIVNIASYMERHGLEHNAKEMLEPIIKPVSGVYSGSGNGVKLAIEFMIKHKIESDVLKARAMACYTPPGQEEDKRTWDQLGDTDFEEGDEFGNVQDEEMFKPELLQYLNQVYGLPI